MSLYAVLVDIPGAVEFYDAVHAETLRRTEGNVEGLLVHVGRRTTSGFQVIEVRESRETYERADREVVAPIIASVTGASPSAGPVSAQVEEFSPRGLVIPGGRRVLL